MEPDIDISVAHSALVHDRLFDGLELLDPGVVPVQRWRPVSEAEAGARSAMWGGWPANLPARKPARPAAVLPPPSSRRACRTRRRAGGTSCRSRGRAPRARPARGAA